MNKMFPLRMTALVLLAASMTGCSKLEEPAPDLTPGANGTQKGGGGWFCLVVDNGIPLNNYMLTLHCMGDVFTDVDGIVQWGPGCPGPDQTSVGGLCLDPDTYYYLKPSTGGAARTFMRFQLVDADVTGLQLLEYDVATNEWTIRDATAFVSYKDMGAGVRLPRCSGPSPSISL